MATDTMNCISQIGETAGDIWHLLDTKGSLPITKLVKEVNAPRDTIMQALGWLAREEKINIEEDARTRVISLR
jgi:predicted transcriptional regulator